MTDPVPDVSEGPVSPKVPKSPLKRFFLRGVVLLLPTIITVWILVMVLSFLHKNLISHATRLVAWAFSLTGLFDASAFQIIGGETQIAPGLWYPSLGVAWLVCLGLVALIGMIFGSFIGHRIWLAVENSIMRLPPIRFVYPYVKQIIDFFFGKRALGFRQVVAVEYPRRGVYSLGFVTGRAFTEIDESLKTKCLSIFIPSSPTPMTGYVIFVPEDDVIYLPMTIDEAFRMTVSAGVIKPELLLRPTGSAAKRPEAASEGPTSDK